MTLLHGDRQLHILHFKPLYFERYVGLRGPGLYWIIPLGIERSATS